MSPKAPVAVLLVLATLISPSVRAQEGQSGQVELPLAVYNQLMESARDPKQLPRPAPASYALGSAQVNVNVTATEPPSGEVQVTLTVNVLEDEWVLVPVLPAGTAVGSAQVNGSNVQLITTPFGLAWSTQKAGSYTMALVYRVDATRSEAGLSLPVPVPQAASITLNATLPGTGLDVAVIPAAGTRTTVSGNTTRVSATVPTTSGVQISWRTPAREGHALSRATYTGQLSGNAVTWSGQFSVDLFSDQTLTLPLLPRTVTLSQLQVDGRDAAILVEGDRFATLVRGRGGHTVVVGFEVPVVREDGPPRIDLQLPAVPVSRFDLTLPGKKEVTVTPASNVTSRERGGSTFATAHVPLTGNVSISWAEAVPDEIRTEVRANAGLYHTVYAEEGVLYVHALIDYDVTRGETNVLRLEVPAAVQVNRVSTPSGAVADWRLSGDGAPPREVTVFLDRQLQGQLVLEVFYDLSLGSGADSGEIEVPLLRSLDAQRQRGMVALLSSQDLALQPVSDDEATRVGENQLPAFVRQAVELTVAHTYKYVETLPRLTVRPTPPERKQGRFDAQVDTLISLGEVTMKGSASVEIDVKSGRIMELALDLPTGVNLLSLTGPAVRNHTVEAEDDRQRINVEFTQEMEGQFRLEVAYEHILADSEAELGVPTLTVDGADVEQGRIAVEALSAVEVQPTAVEQLTALDISELPQQLILRTTNPILMAYKYVHADPPYRLGLTVTRHQVVEVQEATIDSAEYRTLFTRDGLSVTTARFEVRNSGQQFLRIKLPADSEIWSAFVDSQPEKPARTETDDGEVWHLIKIIHSTQSFPVEVIYQTPAAPITFLGRIDGVLPRPRILVTQTRWDVYVPDGVRYGEPTGGMGLMAAGVAVTQEDLDAEMARLGSESGGQVIEPLRLVVPQAGVRFTFEKLYANQRDDDVGFAIPYASGVGATSGSVASLIGALLFWLGLALLVRRNFRAGGAFLALGLGILISMVGYYHVDARPALVLSVLVLAAIAGKVFWDRRQAAAAENEDEL